MATQQGWDDFCSLKEEWRGVLNDIEVIKANLDRLLIIKTTLLDDASRLAAMRSLGNEYPNHNMNSIKADVERIIGLKAILIANGF